MKFSKTVATSFLFCLLTIQHVSASTVEYDEAMEYSFQDDYDNAVLIPERLITLKRVFLISLYAYYTNIMCQCIF